MSIKVVKFGGSSLADAGQFRKVAAIIKSQPERRYVVASAPGKRNKDDIKVTDMLYGCAAIAAKGKSICEAFGAIRERFNGIITDLGIDISLDSEYAVIQAAIEKGADKDYLASRGEYLNSKVLAGYLGFEFVDAADCVFFNEKGSFDPKRTYAAMGERLKNIEYAVIPGFYGSLPDGRIKTFSRGGSDITGAIAARAVMASIYENWTDVSGMLMADPRIVDNPRVIRETTYIELRELAYMGATVLHDEALTPVREVNIPINIRNTNMPDDPGTMIVGHTGSVVDTLITGVAGKGGFASITIVKDLMNSEVGFGRKVLSILEDCSIPFEHLPTGIDTMSVLVSSAALEGFRDTVIQRICDEAQPDSVTVDDNIALIAVVGRSMVQSKGVAGRVLTAIANMNINIRMIDQGSSENNIIIGVNGADLNAATRAIYYEFVR